MPANKAKTKNPILEFWPARDKQTRSMHEIQVCTLSDASGYSELLCPDAHIVGFVEKPEIIPTSCDHAKTEDYEWAPYDVGYMPAGMSVRTTIREPNEVTTVCLPDRFWRNASFETIRAEGLNYRYLHGEKDPVALHLLRSMKKLALHGTAHEWPLLLDSLGTAISVRFMQLLGAKETSSAAQYPNGLSKDRVRRVIDYVEANIDRPIRLTELAEVAALSLYHFQRSFRKAMGITPVRYVWRRRVQVAKRLMRDRSLSLSEVAYLAGFSSQSHFTTIFKREVGVTPGRFRAKL